MGRKPLRESELDKFRQWVEHLRIKSEEIPIIVETEKEKKVLKQLKVKNIIYISKPYYDFAEKIAKKNKNLEYEKNHNLVGVLEVSLLFAFNL